MAQLLLDNGVDANVLKDDLCGSLHLAPTHGHLKVAELLVQHGAGVVDLSNNMNESPLHQAAENRTIAPVCLLIDHGANLYSTDSND